MLCFPDVLLSVAALLVFAACGDVVDPASSTSSVVREPRLPAAAASADACLVDGGRGGRCEDEEMREDGQDAGLSLLQRHVLQKTSVASGTDGAAAGESEEREEQQEEAVVEKAGGGLAAHLDADSELLADAWESSGRRRRRGASHQGAASAAPSASIAGGRRPSSSLTPTAAELKTLAAVVGRLWAIDAPYRLDPGSGYKLNHQAKAASLSSKTDTSPAPLFRSVDQAKLTKSPCASSFLAMLDNFERQTNRAEVETAQEKREVSTFMHELMQTPHMKYVYNVLVAWKSIQPGYAAFSKKVQDMWFTEYGLSRSGPKVSSGFEHVFVGEEKLDKKTHRPTIIGLHNWLQFWREEKAGRIDYLGYVGKAGGDRLVSVRFAWDDDDADRETKSVSTILVGSSVPFEFAMLTCAFIGFNGEAKVPGIYFGSTGPATIKTYSWNAPEGKVVRTAYLEG